MVGHLKKNVKRSDLKSTWMQNPERSLKIFSLHISEKKLQ